jgi:ABC-type Na+ efflux pump permease subunit
MRFFKQLKAMPVTFAFFYLPFAETADAYIDAGTGSIIILWLIGIAAGAFTMLGIYRNKVRTFFKNLLSKSKRNESVDD